jgi:hypothetical protein
LKENGHHRGQRLCRRNQEVRIQRDELPAAQEGRVPHALLRQYRHDGDSRCSSAFPARARRRFRRPNRKLIGTTSTAGATRRVQLRGRLLRQCINLSKENEPQIWDAIKFGSLVENVVMDEETRALDFDDGSITKNTRAVYPGNTSPTASFPGVGGQPKTVIFLTADAFGVLPPSPSWITTRPCTTSFPATPPAWRARSAA